MRDIILVLLHYNSRQLVTLPIWSSLAGVDDPTNPYNNSARPNSWTPALDEPWDYSNDRIYGVNLGGWLVLEPFIVPSLFEKYQNVTPNAALPGGQAVDEWTLSVAMLNDTSDGGGIGQLEEHYKTFIVSTPCSPRSFPSSPFTSFIPLIIALNLAFHPADGARLCRDRWRRTQLDSSPHSLLGYRDMARRALPREDCMELRASRV